MKRRSFLASLAGVFAGPLSAVDALASSFDSPPVSLESVAAALDPVPMYLGEWEPSRDYAAGDLVLFNGAVYALYEVGRSQVPPSGGNGSGDWRRL